MSGLNSEFDDADESPGFLLWKATNKWQAAQRMALKPFDLTHVQFVLLASLVWLGTNEPISQKKLAEHAGTDEMMTSQVLRALEKKKLVIRKLSHKDKRVILTAVTKNGVQLANTALKAVEQTDRVFFGDLASLPTDLILVLKKLSQ